jgi:class 3 adenylate cyclase
LTQAHSIYHQGWCLAAKRRNLDDAIYTGINAAATALFMGKAQLARTIARKVRAICQTRLRKRRDYWAEATLGEAAVISGSFAEAEEWYSRAAQLGRGQYSDLSATRHQARLLMDHLGEDRYHFDHCFSIPKVIVFAGHMIDQPGRPQPRFPAALEQKVRQEIAVRLRRHGEKIGYSGAACGSDILFLEEMLEQKGEANITLPFPPKEFQAASVDIIPRATWGQRFHRVLKQATRVIVASEHRVSGSLVAYEYANLIQEGLARLHARMLDTDVIPLVVWDHRPCDGPQGTASIVEHWRSHGLKPEVVDIASLLTESIVIRPSSRAGRPTSAKTPYLADTAPGFPQEILAMLFADVVGYSKLTEEQIPRFARYFMGEVARLIAASPRTPVMKNTWGDALYLVFTRVGDAGTFALDLCDKVCGTDWAQKGLPKGLSLRIGLHAGPAFTCDDPVLEHRNCIGSHVNWAARIEPITPPGQVYASEPFAALAAAEGVRDFACDNVGRTPLAKGFRASPTYHLRRRRP